MRLLLPAPLSYALRDRRPGGYSQAARAMIITVRDRRWLWSPHDLENIFFNVNSLFYNDENSSRSWSSALDGHGNVRELVALRGAVALNIP
jgi:hypothetical protein